MGDKREATYKLFCVGDLAQVPLGQLEYSQNVQPQQVPCGLGREDVCQFEQSSAGHDWEWELVHESWALNDGLTLFPYSRAAQACSAMYTQHWLAQVVV